MTTTNSQVTAQAEPRNVAHMPVAFDPAAYEYVGGFDNSSGDPGARVGHLNTYTRHGVTVEAYSPLGAERQALNTLLRRSATSRYGHDRSGQCDHCGAHIRYVAVLRHVPTGDHIASGEQCLDNRFALASKADFDAMRKASAEERAEQRIVKSVRAFLDDNPDLVGILWPVPDAWEGLYAHGVLTDMHRSLRRYGSLSERQVAFARKLAAEAPEQLVRKARIEAEHAAAVDAPEGKVTVTGTVVSRKRHESMYGEVWKLTVRSDNGGWLVWVSEPSKVQCERDDRVRFNATLTRSDRDSKFAFGKRPTQFVILEHATADNTVAAPARESVEDALARIENEWGL